MRYNFVKNKIHLLAWVAFGGATITAVIGFLNNSDSMASIGLILMWWVISTVGLKYMYEGLKKEDD